MPVFNDTDDRTYRAPLPAIVEVRFVGPYHQTIALINQLRRARMLSETRIRFPVGTVISGAAQGVALRPFEVMTGVRSVAQSRLDPNAIEGRARLCVQWREMGSIRDGLVVPDITAVTAGQMAEVINQNSNDVRASVHVDTIDLSAMVAQNVDALDAMDVEITRHRCTVTSRDRIATLSAELGERVRSFERGSLAQIFEDEQITIEEADRNEANGIDDPAEPFDESTAKGRADANARRLKLAGYDVERKRLVRIGEIVRVREPGDIRLIGQFAFNDNTGDRFAVQRMNASQRMTWQRSRLGVVMELRRLLSQAEEM